MFVNPGPLKQHMVKCTNIYNLTQVATYIGPTANSILM